MRANAINAAWPRNMSGMVQCSEKRVMIAPDWKTVTTRLSWRCCATWERWQLGLPAVGRPLLHKREGAGLRKGLASIDR